MARRSVSRSRRGGARAGGRRRFAIVGLSLFALVDVALIALALGVVDLGGDSAPRPIAASPTAVAAPSTSSTPSATPTPTPTPTPPPLAGVVQRALAVVDAQTAWRAERGSCGTQAVIELSTDGGATWTATEPRNAEAQQVLWLWARDDEFAQSVVTAGDDCELDGIRTFTSGTAWTTNDGVVEQAAFIDASGALVTADALTAPCAVPVAVADGASSLAVLCDDGTVFGRDHDAAADAGWTQSSVPGAVAITAAGEGFALAVQATEGCEGIALVSLGAEALASGQPASAPNTCLDGGVDPTATVIAAGPDVVWLWSGAELGIVELSEVGA